MQGAGVEDEDEDVPPVPYALIAPRSLLDAVRELRWGLRCAAEQPGPRSAVAGASLARVGRFLDAALSDVGMPSGLEASGARALDRDTAPLAWRAAVLAVQHKRNVDALFP